MLCDGMRLQTIGMRCSAILCDWYAMLCDVIVF